MPGVIKAYYHLAKPGIIYGNLLTATAGFMLATSAWPNLRLLAGTMAGIALVMAAGCVFNNYMDQGIDAKMTRTKKRALVSGQISGQDAIIYGTVLAGFGFLALYIFTNLLTIYLGIIALFTYVVLYGITKRKSVHGTLVGSIAGALPPTAGYTAVSGQFDTGAVLLFLIMTFWQMPHFYAIAIYRGKDYAAAEVPVLPNRNGATFTKITSLAYIMAFTVTACLLTIYGYTGVMHLAVCVLAGGYWFYRGVKDFKTADNITHARKMFFVSLKVLTIFSAITILHSVLP